MSVSAEHTAKYASSSLSATTQPRVAELQHRGGLMPAILSHHELRRGSVLFVICFTFLNFVCIQSSAAQSLEEKMRAVLPSKDEDRWLEIDWHTNIAEAREAAERQGKPILFWVMNGNPLGCG